MPDSQRFQLPPTRRPLLSSILIAILILFYSWVAGSGPRARMYGYSELTDGFLKGQLHLSVEPSPQLSSLPDPSNFHYDTAYQLRDMSLYKGKYYMYFGPAPALLLYAPLRIVNYRVPDNLATLLFSSAGFLMMVSLLRFLAQQFDIDVPLWAELLAILTLGLCSAIPFLLRRGVVYEVAIACGFLCFAAGTNLLARGILTKPYKLAHLGLASLSFGLAIASRPDYLFAVCVMIAAAIYVATRNGVPRELIIALLGPLALCGFLLGLYNYLRFESWNEFGLRYQLAGSMDVKSYHLIDIRRLLPGLWQLLFEPPQLSSVFPFFGLNVSRAGDTPSSSFLNPTAGILLAFPVIAILVLLPLLGKKLGKHAPHLAGVVKVLVASGVAVVFTIALVTPPAFRYVADFASLFLVAAMLLWFFLIRSGEHRAIARFIVPAAMFWGIGFGFATGFLGGPVSPYVPDWIAAISRSVRARQGTQDQYGPLELQVRFGEGKKGRIEPLVATGRTGVGDVLFVGWLSENTVQFGLDHVGSQPFVGPGLLLDPKRTYRISVTMGSLYPAQDAIPVLTPGFAGIDVKRRLLVTMDGIPVLSDAREFYDASGAEATVGKNPVGGFVKPEFRGEIISSQRLLKPFF